MLYMAGTSKQRGQKVAKLLVAALESNTGGRLLLKEWHVCMSVGGVFTDGLRKEYILYLAGTSRHSAVRKLANFL